MACPQDIKRTDKKLAKINKAICLNQIFDLHENMCSLTDSEEEVEL